MTQDRIKKDLAELGHVQDTFEINFNIFNIKVEFLKKIYKSITDIWNSEIHIRNVIKEHIFERDILDIKQGHSEDDIEITLKDFLYYPSIKESLMKNNPVLLYTNNKELNDVYSVKYKPLTNNSPINKILDYIHCVLLEKCIYENLSSKDLFVEMNIIKLDK